MSHGPVSAVLWRYEHRFRRLKLGKMYGTLLNNLASRRVQIDESGVCFILPFALPFESSWVW